jgi:hypothetical protein
MIAVLQYKLPDESEEYEVAMAGGRALSALYDIRQEIFRPMRKHGYTDARVTGLIDKINAFLPADDCAVEELIGLLEEKFSSIITEYNIPGGI